MESASEIHALRDEIAALRKEVASLRDRLIPDVIIAAPARPPHYEVAQPVVMPPYRYQPICVDGGQVSITCNIP